MQSPSRTARDLRRILALALLYTVVARASLLLAAGPSVPTPLFPAAGIALACTLAWGPRMAWGALLGSLLNDVWHQWTPPPSPEVRQWQPILINAAIFAIGNSLQPVVSAWAVRRVLPGPLLLQDLRELGRFYGVGALGGLISALLGTGSLYLTGMLALGQTPEHLALWWLGDACGVLIAAPAMLTLIGRPAHAWRPRRLALGLPLLLATLVLAQGVRLMREADEQRNSHAFERDSALAMNAMKDALNEALLALKNSGGLFVVAPHLTRNEFRHATAHFVGEASHLQAMGWVRPIRRAARAQLDAEARAEGLDGFTARDRGRPTDLAPPAGEDMLVIRLIEPLRDNAGALGVNQLSIPAPRAAAQAALASGRPTATSGFPLSQFQETEVGVVVYQPVYAAPSAGQVQPALQGLVFTTLRPASMLRDAAAQAPAYLKLCLVELDGGATPRRLAGPEGCGEAKKGERKRDIPLAFAGRRWAFCVTGPARIPREGAPSSWAFAVVGLASAALLGMLLMVVTGRSRLVEAQVRQRTVALKREVQERERASAAALESERRFRTVFNNSPIGLLFTDETSQPQLANAHYCRLTGYSLEELLQMHVADFTHPDDRAEDLRMKELLLAGEVDLYYRYKRYIRKDGQLIHVRATVSKVLDDDGPVRRSVSAVEDISDQLRMRELERARDAAEGANQAKNEFLSRMSHELRTPLNAMLGFTQLLELDNEQRLSTGQKTWAAQVLQAGWHLLDMIDDTLDFSRIESGQMRLELRPQWLAPLLEQARSLVEADADYRGIRLTQRIEPAAAEALGDATRIKQVLINLLSNAVKYNCEGGRVDITVSRHLDAGGQAWVDIGVADTGMGLSAEQQAHLFQPFNRLGRERSSIGGTGIGLVICKRLADLMGGALLVHSELSRGSRFVLRLPLASGAASSSEQPPAATARPAQQTASRVLYVEDNPVNAELMQSVLAQRPQIALTLSADGTSGLAAAAQRPDLVLLDMQLPDMDGLEWLARARSAGLDMPVVVVSATALPEQIERARRAGALDYLTKPIDVPVLLALIDRVLSEAPIRARRP